MEVVLDWILEQGSIVVSYAIGVGSSYFYMNKVTQEKVQMLQAQVENLIKENQRLREESSAKIDKLTHDYKDEMRALREESMTAIIRNDEMNKREMELMRELFDRSERRITSLVNNGILSKKDNEP